MGDPVSLAAVLYEHHMATWGPDNLRERLAVATEVVQLAEAAGDRVMALRGRGFLLANQLEQGDLAGLGRGLEDDDRAAQALGQLHFAWHVPLFRAGQELLAGRLDEAERLAAEALALGRRAPRPAGRHLPHDRAGRAQVAAGAAARAGGDPPPVRRPVPGQPRLAGDPGRAAVRGRPP
jgi:hypothetical protein